MPTPPTRSFLKHRLTLRHGMTPVDVVVAAGCAEVRIIPSGSLIGRFSPVPMADVGEYPGTVELVRSYDGTLHGVVVLGPTGLVAARDTVTGEWNPPDLVQHFDDLPSLEHAKAMAEAAAKTPWAETWTCGPYAEMGMSLFNQALQLRNLTYLQIAFPGAREADRCRIVDAMGSAGLKGLFDSNYHFRQLVRYSVACGGPGAPIGDVAARLGASEHDVADDLAKLNAKVRPILGVDVFEIKGGHATSAV